MHYLSPAVIFILAVAAILIVIRFARKMFLNWAVLIILVMTIFVCWPKSLELLAGFVSVIHAVIFKH